MSEKILYVEDDPTLAFVTSDNLSAEGYEVILEKDGRAGWKRFNKEQFDICILDVMLPEMDGFQLAEKIREVNSQVPIIFLTAKSMKEDKLVGLKIGADDYITKPFSIEELILKIQVFIKRKFIQTDEKEKTFRVGKFTLDYSNLLLKSDTDQVLTQKEADLLKELIINKNQIIKREQILEKLWGKNDYFLGRSMDVFISRLRKHLKSDTSLKIENVHGVGFKLVEGW